MGRATQGVRLINLKENDIIASVAIVSEKENGEGSDTEDIIQKNENDEEIGKEFDD
jgi:DNA gyrase subunit A